MDIATGLLAAGVLFGFWDQLIGRRRWQGDLSTFRKRAKFAWIERRATILGSLLVIGSVIVGIVGD